MPWAVAGAAVAAGGSIISGMMGADASKAAAKTQAEAADRATQAQLGMYNQTVDREQPFVQAGTNGLADLTKLLGIGSPGGPTSPVLQMLGIGGPGGVGGTGQIDPRTFQGSPGYQFQLQQGTNAVTNSAAANGGLGGNALRQLMGVGQQTANQGWQQYLGNVGNAWQSQIGNISSLVAGGQNAAANLGTIGTQVGGQIGSNIWGAGNATANGITGSASAFGGGLNNASQSIMTLLANPKFQSLFKGDGTSGGGAGIGVNGNDYSSPIGPTADGGFLGG